VDHKVPDGEVLTHGNQRGGQLVSHDDVVCGLVDCLVAGGDDGFVFADAHGSGSNVQVFDHQGFDVYLAGLNFNA